MSSVDVILSSSVRGLGRVGEIVRVKSGYATNYLIPSRFAMIATKRKIEEFKTKENELKKIDADLSEKSNAFIEKLKDQKIVIKRQSDKFGNLYGSVSTKDIYLIIVEMYPDISQVLEVKGLTLLHKIRNIGAYNCILNFSGAVEHTLSVNIESIEMIQ